MKQIGAVVALGIGALLMSGCDARTAMRFGWPAGITPEAKKMGDLWTWSVIAALVMGIIVWGLIFWTITFHRHKAGKDEFPRQTAYNVPLELGYTAVPFVIIAVLFYFTVVVQNDVEKKTSDPKVIVDVTAFQWNWKFGYRDVTFTDGNTYNGFERAASPFELQSRNVRTEHGEEHPILGPAGGRDDDIRDYLKFNKIETVGSSTEIPILVLPTGKRIEFEIASADVIHSFWVPEFLFKRDVMPFPKQNHSDSVFQIQSIDRSGAFVGRCAEMCGTYHSMMNFEVRAVSPQKFDSYIRYREQNPTATNAQALESICEVPKSVTTVPFNTRRATNGDTPKELGDASNTSLQGCTVGANG
ncbi:cytochrome c oxidase subunit II [Gordonia hankookensis]|uniref:cytochrome-c oxidase n=1 Tax=Gordonia hankookensis TaxID=589403 RepID=A0ABR7W8I8_9ACTN|nr:cytochrome c oxidase subunit II [Gordonia hankookensis]MBD1318147.1 cytochrome c oxidase subunit II [Gordonia hankookensis]NDZ95502.1 cytochrome c oxidase subunit II [Streptomyces sp. SID11726]NEB25668.1 cytochrome c oxidase subunit II [Streptomyces sp. SID6673]